MLQRLYDIIYEFKEYVILACLVIISFILMALNDNPQIKRIRAISTVAFGVVQEKLSVIPTYFGLKSENELLRRINIELADEVQRLREAKLESLRLRQMIGLKERSSFDLIPSKIVNKNLTLHRNTITLNIGSAEGVKPQMPVINDAGLVGLVTIVTEHYSVVNILLNTDFRASAKIQRSRVDGIVAWDGKNLFLKNVAKTWDVMIGDLIITSEHSGVFPPGIRIGIVKNIQDPQSALFKTITLTPNVNFIKLEEVFVVKYSIDERRSEIDRQTNP